MLTVRIVLGPGIGGALYSNILQERQQHYVTRYAHNVDAMNHDAATSYQQTLRGMQYQDKSATEAEHMAAISTKGRVQAQACCERDFGLDNICLPVLHASSVAIALSKAGDTHVVF